MPDEEDDFKEELDYLVDDVIENKKNKKKKKNSGRKGKSAERLLCKILEDRFSKYGTFTRVIGSGNRTKQVKCNDSAKKILTSDIVTPDCFLFSIECKNGYEEIDLISALESGNKVLESFFEQASRDAEYVGRMPLVCWKKSFKPWTAWVEKDKVQGLNFEFSYSYKKWIGVSLTSLLSLPDEYFVK